MKTTFEGITSTIMNFAGTIGKAGLSIGFVAAGIWLATYGIVDCKNLVFKPKQAKVE